MASSKNLTKFLKDARLSRNGVSPEYPMLLDQLNTANPRVVVSAKGSAVHVPLGIGYAGCRTTGHSIHRRL